MNDIHDRINHAKQFDIAVEAAFRAHQADDLARSVEQAARAHNHRMLWITLGAAIIFVICAALIVAWLFL